MPARRLSLLLSLCGAALLVLGLAFWRQDAIDLALHAALRAAPGGLAARIARGLAIAGGLPVMGPVALAGAGLLAVRRRARPALWLVATIASGRRVVEGLKLLVQRPRPPLGDRLADVTSWSFPSSHSAGSLMTCLALAVLTGARGPALAVALAYAGAVGWSRLALGVHWPSDVVAGWGCGMVWIGVALRWLPRKT